MTDFTRYGSQRRDIQDHIERMLWGTREDVTGAGSMMSVRGTGTQDYEVPIMNFGYSFNIDPDSNAEVVVLSLGSDVDDKVALPTIPRDLQYQWPVGTGGVQHPTDADRRIEFNGDEMWLKDGNYKLGDNKEVEVIVAGGNVIVNINADTTVNVTGTTDVTSTGDMSVTAPNLTVTGDTTINGTLDVNGASVQHNGTNIGDTHQHPHGDPAGNTGVPF